MPGKLSAYHAKRNFEITSEPRGATAAGSGERLRFVVQKHDARKLHYDFRLELDGTLKSWAVPKGPSLNPSEKRLAVHVEDHPLDYIDFEGDIPEHQYGAGHVEVWDTGFWEPHGDPVAGYRAGKLKFRLEGGKLHGGWTLVRTRLQGGSKEQWLLIKEKDDEARTGKETDAAMLGAGQDATTVRPRRAKSGGGSGIDPATLPGSRKAPLPEAMRPQLATLADAVPVSGNWIYEIKFDGYRMLARIDDGAVRLFSREGRDWTAKLPAQAAAIKALGLKNGWLDGEIVALDKQGIPSFQLLQKAFDAKSTTEVMYFIFDVPYFIEHDLRAVPLVDRRALLQRVLAPAAGPLRFSTELQHPPQQLLDNACAMALEGIIGKRRDAPYVEKRNEDWIKLKCRLRQEFVIAGYTQPQGSRQYFGALLLGVHDDDDGGLRYAGRVGTGFDSNALQAIFKQLRPLEQRENPFAQFPPGVSRAQTHWVKPELVAEVSFAEWTDDGLLRHAVFPGLRSDKPAREIRREQPRHAPGSGARGAASDDTDSRDNTDNTVHGVRITHPERVIDAASGLTKLDLVHYYEQVAPHLLPFLKNRPVYLLRAPEGIGGEQFFQKHANRLGIPGIGTLPAEVDPDHAPLMVINSEQALVGAAQMGTIELHTCNATADRIDRPDCMVFDLDPDPALPWKAVIDGAQLTKTVLDELGLKSFLKTSGGKGLHLVVPLARRHGWDVVAEFSLAVAQHLARTLPSHFSAKMGEKNRVGKIFVDTLRNRRQASTIAPYSARARPGLPVATPIAWEELPRTSSAAMWTISSLPNRLASLKTDPWRDYFKTRQMLTEAMKKKIGMVKK
jgi:bifunctional non-homologous end joining protein LigD